ncbi:uncharacterized protein LOC131639174 [Vicia villosa]|uniref:uncharacterized protein LOC131639174 n=1 Tax=Vicia villosa TaxID=3911 RepID=UPI00273AEBE3|nr:uncharacterized protein LOC131639174 [Vicia villosa]
MSQSSKSPSPKTASDSDSRTPNINPNEVLAVAPLRMVSAENLRVKKPRSPHARRPKEAVRGKTSNPSPSSDLENLTKEGSQYTHQAIAQIVTRILDEQRQVLGISVPLQTVTDEEKNVEAVDVAKDVTDTREDAPNGDSGKNVVDLDEFSDNDLVASVNPSIVKRLMTRKGKKVVDQNPSKRRNVPVGPSKSWSKVIPKKRKAQVMDDSDSDVEVDVQDIPLKKKPTSSKLAAKVPDVPIDNISFHSTLSVNRWKYVYQKRLAIERELAQN